MTRRNNRYVSSTARARTLTIVGRADHMAERLAAESAVVASSQTSRGLVQELQLAEGYLFVEPDGTLTTDVSGIALFDGVASELHDIGGASAAVPTVSGAGWNDPDDIFRRLFGAGIVELCRADNLEGLILYSTFVDAKGVGTGVTDTILSLAHGMSIDTHSLDTGAEDFRELRTFGLCLDNDHLTKLFNAGEEYPTGVGDGSWNKVNDLFHVGFVVNKFKSIGGWVDVWFEGNVVMSETISNALNAFKPTQDRGITMWADIPDAQNDGSALAENQVKLMNHDVLSQNKTHSLLIKRFGSDQTDLIPTIMAEHYRDRTVMPASAL